MQSRIGHRIGPNKAVHCTPCRMQMQNAECRIGPKAMNWHPMQDADAECRMQNRAQSQMPCTRCRMQDADAGCKIRAQSCELHPTDKLFGSDFASCILHPAILHHAEESILGPINAWTRSSRPATSIQLYTAGGGNVSFPTCKVHPLYTSRPSKVHSSVGVCSTAAAQSSEPRSGRRLLGQHPRLRLRLFY